MKMTPAFLIVGSIVVLWASIFSIIILPSITMEEKPSESWRTWTADEAAGHRLYVDNGCSYCHSLFIRTFDWDLGAERIAQRGDYVGMEPAILGTERTGPDLSQEGGEHPDDWQTAHFINPRFTSPASVMPTWEFLGPDRIRKLTAYVQSQGGKGADPRVERQANWKQQSLSAYNAGAARNIEWLHGHVPQVWQEMPNPYPATPAALQRGKRVYQQFCIGCHGGVGDGRGPARPWINPPPLDFTQLRDHLVDGRYIGGLFYYQIMNGVTGTAMPYFKKHLESEKIWDVSNYVALRFVGYTDANIEPRGIDAAYEPEWKNPYTPPTTVPPKEAR